MCHVCIAHETNMSSSYHVASATETGPTQPKDVRFITKNYILLYPGSQCKRHLECAPSAGRDHSQFTIVRTAPGGVSGEIIIS